jgi:hypothetical protein
MSVFSQHFGQPVLPGDWLENAVFGLDRWLRRRQGVFEYTDDPTCIFRIQCVQAEEPLTLSGGARIEPGTPILNLHLWNEHIPLMGSEGATVGWARHLSRAVQSSLQQLAAYLDGNPSLCDIAALRADMRLGTAERSAQLIRLMSHYGFEPAAEVIRLGYWRSSGLHRFGENILIFLLILATNPVAVGTPVLRRDHKLVYLSRAALKRRYGGAWGDCNDARSPGAC